MSRNEPTSLTETSSAVPVPGKHVQTLPDRSDIEWLAPSLTTESSQPPGQGLGPYLHALRRRWLVSTTFGTLAAIALAAVAWYFCAPEYTANAFVQVSSTEQHVLSPTADPVTRFDIYKGTQQALLKLDFVLIEALRPSEISNLPIVREQDDPVAWLQKELKVDFPGDAEIMRVGMKGENSADMKTLVDAVVDAYIGETETKAGDKEKARLEKLRETYREKAEKLRDDRVELSRLVQTLGTGDSDTLTLKQQNFLQQFFEFNKEGVAVQFERMRAERDLALQQDALHRAEQSQEFGGGATGSTKDQQNDDEENGAAEEIALVTKHELDVALRSDGFAILLLNDKAALEAQLRSLDTVAADSSPADIRRARLEEELRIIATQLEGHEEDLEQELREYRLAVMKEGISRQQIEIEILKAQEDQLKNDADEIRKKADAIGGSSIEVEIKQGEIKLFEELVGNINQELQRTEIENQWKSRVTRLGIASAQCTNRNFRFALAAFAASAGFFLPVIAIAWWDTRSRRINSLADVSQEIGLDVIGSVPIIPSRVARRLGALPPRHQYWQTILTESVDGIAARLLHQAEHEETRVILVSSATENEGKTTIASQLALSLARTGRRTVLVDFDLRRPAIDGVFGLPSEPGVSDVLKHQSSVSEVIHQGDGDNLDIITAGQWDGGSVRVLANGVTGSFLKELRSDYDFVILDACPILPVADTRIISQYVDGVVLSILRDVSQIPKVTAACEILQAFGVRTLGAIVIGTASDVHSRSSRYLADATV